MGCVSPVHASSAEISTSVHRGTAKGAASPDPVLKEVPLGDGSTLTVGVASASLAYCFLAAYGDAAVFLDAQTRPAFDRAHVRGAWCLDSSGNDGKSSSSRASPRGSNDGGNDAQDAALRSHCSLRTVIVYGAQGNPLTDERIKAILRQLQRVGARQTGHPLVLRGGLAEFSRRFSFCVCQKGGEKMKPLGGCPAEVLAPDWGGTRPAALYLGTEKCLQEPAAGAIDAMRRLQIGTVFNLSGKPCPKTNCKVIEVKASANSDGMSLQAREACAKLHKQSGPCMLYGAETAAVAAALFLVEVLPTALNCKDAATSLIKQRFPPAELDSADTQLLLATAAGLHCPGNEAANGPGGPRVPAAPPPTPPNRLDPPVKRNGDMHSVAPVSGQGGSSPNTPRKGGKIVFAKEATAAAEICARLHQRDRKGAEVALTTLRTALNHILEKPAEEKYKRLKGNNARVNDEILAYPEAVALLRLCGFTKVGEDLVLPEFASLQAIRDVLAGMSVPLKPDCVLIAGGPKNGNTSSRRV